MKCLYFDESGFTGTNLMDKDQPIFCYLGLECSPDIETAFLELKAKYRYGDSEVKGTNIIKHTRGQNFLIVYRNGEDGSNKKYTSVLTTIGIVDSIKYGFQYKEDFFDSCQNRSVFPEETLEDFWKKNKDTLLVVKFIFVKSLTQRLTLGYLWAQAIVERLKGPRPFTRISDEQFNQILYDSQTKISFVEEQ